MPKSKLTTEEMKDLRAKGMTQKQIGVIAGISQAAVGVRLREGRNRNDAKKRYQEFDEPAQAAYSERVRQAYHDAQKKSLEGARLRGVPWTNEEIDFLKNYGAEFTTLELALKMSRTYASIRRAASRFGIALKEP